MLKAVWQQYLPQKPTFTERDVPPGSQVGKVFIVTGTNKGIGYELAKMLYFTGATIYLTVTPGPASPTTLKTLYLDLAHLTTIEASTATFAAQEIRFDILWNNAGIGGKPKGTTTKQNL
ncbi:hypothetical protein CC78DRAFT_585671 [Lojkania enalia]|uniref:NAD(P)-binding protein n=1 Tax=Lojkania enalia TaxID=147567 RepID=A0A9P4MW14_9PLEO|nr:hypothetical protein CC78DRAFT_585671 [Didymosphaeria enalia]